MSYELLQDPRLYEVLTKIDEELAAEIQSQGCSKCGGTLHRANYPRRPRGGATDSAAVTERLSFCCERDGCRKRHTPPSVRFFGRRVYLSAVVLLVSAMQSGVSDAGAHGLRKLLGVGRSTLKRWRRWWRCVFVDTQGWIEARARIVPSVDTDALPRSLIERFAGTGRESLARILRFLSPVTTSFGCRLIQRS